MRSLRVVHVITGVGVGGAELALCRLLEGSDRDRFQPHVVSLLPLDVVGERIRALDVAVESLNMRRSWPAPWGLLRLVRRLRALQADVVQTWMYHADLLGGLAARGSGKARVVWAIHHASPKVPATKRRTYWVARTCALLSPTIPAAIVCCSRAGRDAHAELGYATDRLVVVPNGYDLAEFTVDPTARAWLRHELSIPDEAAVVGLVARYDPLKDHRGFLQAAALCQAACPDVRYVLCGNGVSPDNRVLVEAIDAAGLSHRVHLLGYRSDVARIMAGLDVGALSSRSEAFPNVVAETMACGVPCAVTNVGDVPDIVGDTGRVVPPGDPAQLAAALLDLLRLPSAEREALGRRARERVHARFGLPRMVAAYQALWEGSLAGSTPSEARIRSTTDSRS